MRLREMEQSRFYQHLAVPALLVITLFFLVPLVITLSSAFIGPGGGFSLAPITRVFTDPYILRIMRFTLIQASLSTLTSLVVALGGAYLLSSYSFRFKRLILALSAVPFVIPSILVVLGFVIFFGNNGFLNTALMKLFSLPEPPVRILYSYKAIILAHTFYNFPIIMNLVATYAMHLDRRLEAASYTLGASKAKTFFAITLPRLLPAIISASSLVFLFCFSSFAIILVLGGGPRYTTMEVEIYRQARMVGNTGAAAALSLFSIAVTSLMLIAYNRSQRRLAKSEAYLQPLFLEKRPAGLVGRALAALYTIITLLFVLAPIISVIVRSVYSSSGFTLRWYRQLLNVERATSHMGSALTALVNSLLIALIVSFIAVSLGIGLAASIQRRRRGRGTLELLGMLSMTVSSVIIGLGYFLIASRLVGRASLSYTLVVLAHLVIALPFALRVLLPEYRKIPATYTNSARTLGSTPARAFFAVELPLLKSAMVSSAIFAFAISMGEFNATLTLASSTIVTLPIVMYRLIGSYNYQGACALGTILIAVSALVFIATTATKGKKHAY